MSKLTEIQRFRMTVEMVNNLGKLEKYGINKSKFVRQVIQYKIKTELPILIVDEIRNKNLIKIPF